MKKTILIAMTAALLFSMPYMAEPNYAQEQGKGEPKQEQQQRQQHHADRDQQLPPIQSPEAFLDVFHALAFSAAGAPVTSNL